MQTLVFLALTSVAGIPLLAQTNAPSPTTVAPTASTSTNAGSIDPFSDPLIKQIVVRHEKAVNGDAQETKALTADLEKWTREQPNNHLLQAYLGSVYTLDSRDAWPGPGKLTYLRNGGKLLDSAVEADPENPAVRFVRAVDYYELPFFFGKGKDAYDDFQVLLKQIDGRIKTPYVLDAETKQGICYFAGLSLKKYGQVSDAKAVWIKGLALAPDSALAPKIKTELQKMR